MFVLHLEGVYTYSKWIHAGLKIQSLQSDVKFISLTHKIHGAVKLFLYQAGIGM